MRRERYTKPFVLILFLAGFGQGSHEAGNVTLSRSSREVDGKYKYLIFPQGSNVQVGLIRSLTLFSFLLVLEEFTRDWALFAQPTNHSRRLLHLPTN